jgi:hypothetical protein
MPPASHQVSATSLKLLNDPQIDPQGEPPAQKGEPLVETRACEPSAEKNDPQGDPEGDFPAKKGEPQVEPCACEPSAEKNDP